MNSIDFETLIITIFVLVDDWYQQEGKALKGKSPGAKAEMSDSEIMTLAVIMDYLPFPGETQFIGFIRANYGQWFPHLLEQSQFNRRLRKLGQMLEILRRKWVKQLGGENATSFVEVLISMETNRIGKKKLLTQQITEFGQYIEKIKSVNILRLSNV